MSQEPTTPDLRYSTAYLGNPHDSPIWEAISDELHAARTKFPDAGGSLAALTEEVGELAKAVLSEPAENVRAEALQVAAMAIRVAEEGDHTLDQYRTKIGLEPLAARPSPAEPPQGDRDRLAVWAREPGAAATSVRIKARAAALAQTEPLDAAKNVADAIGGAWSPDEAEAVARAYVAGHRDGVGCGIESAGFGFVECEHVGHLAARLTEADDE